jgi:hypothetical protein
MMWHLIEPSQKNLNLAMENLETMESADSLEFRED